MLATKNKIENLENIPQELKKMNHWIVWKGIKQNDGKVSKVPYDITGQYQKSFKEPYSFQEAKESLKAGLVDGVGFALEGSGYTCLDFDGDSLDDIPEQLRVYENHTYAEISPSGNGIHVWFKGDYVGEKNKKGKVIRKTNKDDYKIEWFFATGYVTFTGNALNDLPISDEQMILEQLYNSTYSNSDIKKSSIPDVEGNLQNRTDDDAVLDKALTNKQTRLLFNNETKKSYGDGSHSSKDHALLKDIAKITSDPEQIERLFKRSALYREPPEKHHTYPARSIERAMEEVAFDKNNSFSISIPQKDKKYNGKLFESKVTKGAWWFPNENGSTTFLHADMGRYILQNNHIVKYPDSDGYTYIYNNNTGIYEIDKTNRRLKGIIRSLEVLKINKIREVQEYILDTSDVIEKESTDYIAVENGLLSVETLEFKQFSPNVFLTSKIPTRYNESAHDDFVIDTLKKVTKNHKPSINNLLEMFASVLYPKVLVPKMFYLYGSSAHNGKSSILYLIHKAFNNDGGRISAVSPQKLAENTFAGSSMYGKLANIVDDQPDQIIEDAGTLKTVITGGYVDIEQKGQDAKTVEMNLTMITASNYYPNFKEHGNQINRRLHIIPFEHNFSTDPDALPEIESMEKLSTDSAREYVLKLAVDTLRKMLQRDGADKLTPNEKSDSAKEDFAEHNDPLSDFYHDFSREYIESKAGSDIIKEYNEWCDLNSIIHKLGDKRLKENICNHYQMEWKPKKIRINGKPKTVRGFKTK